MTSILEAADDARLFAPWFRDRATYEAWFAFLAALFALPMTGEQMTTYKRHTGRQEVPTEPHTEGWLVIGRRGGKSFFMALIAVYLACFRTYREHLAPGERATVMIIATDRRQARVIVRYVGAMLTRIPMLAEMVERETADTFDLSNAVTIEVGTASFRTTRGYSYAAVLADELAFWRTDDAAEPDYAVLDAIRPGMASIPGSVLLCASSPYARKGALWDAFKRYWGKDDAPLVWKATTRQMNPTIRQSVIDQALERDHASASAEYLAEWRSDIETFIDREVVEAAVDPGVYERAPVSSIAYSAGVDPAGGSGGDSFTLAISHAEGGDDDHLIVLDAVREHRPPFSPEAVIKEHCALLKSYGIASVTGDRWGGRVSKRTVSKARYHLRTGSETEV